MTLDLLSEVDIKIQTKSNYLKLRLSNRSQCLNELVQTIAKSSIFVRKRPETAHYYLF